MTVMKRGVFVVARHHIVFAKWKAHEKRPFIRPFLRYKKPKIFSHSFLYFSPTTPMTHFTFLSLKTKRNSPFPTLWERSYLQQMRWPQLQTLWKIFPSIKIKNLATIAGSNKKLASNLESKWTINYLISRQDPSLR